MVCSCSERAMLFLESSSMQMEGGGECYFNFGHDGEASTAVRGGGTNKHVAVAVRCLFVAIIWEGIKLGYSS